MKREILVDYVPSDENYKLKVDCGTRRIKCCYSETDERNKFVKEFTLCVYVSGKRISEYFAGKDFEKSNLPIIISKLEELAKCGASVEEVNSAITTVLMNLYYESTSVFDSNAILDNGVRVIEE